MKCELCHKEFKSLKGLAIHLNQSHDFIDVEMQDYYDKYILTNNKDLCFFCGNKAIFKGFTKGYHKICDRPECLTKSRASNTIGCYMCKYDIDEQEAQIMLDEYKERRKLTYIETIKEKVKENPNFNRERFQQCKEFWIKRGYSEEESLIKSKESQDNINSLTFDKVRKNIHLYTDCWPTQIKYWLKKGYSEKEANEKLIERQTTFSLEKCKLKYGDEDGEYVWRERNRKWSEKVEAKYINGEFSKEPDFNSKAELNFFEKLLENIELNEKYYCSLTEKYTTRISGNTYSYDFVYKDKIIEFNGTYWHCDPRFYSEDFYHKHKQKTAKEIWVYDELRMIKSEQRGFKYYVVWEWDWKYEQEDTIKKCKEFLKND